MITDAVRDEEEHLDGDLGHQRRNSQVIKKKLFEEIKRISYLEEIALNQLERNSRLVHGEQLVLKSECE